MRFNSRAQASSYIDAGQRSGNSSRELYRDINRASPDYTALINKIRDIQSARRQAEMNYAGKIGKAKMEGNVIFQRQKATSDLESARFKAKADTKMAGLLGALGSDVVSTVYDKVTPEPKPPAPQFIDLDPIIKKYTQPLEDLFDYEPAVIIDGKVYDPNPNYGLEMPEMPSYIEQEQTDGAPQVSTPNMMIPNLNSDNLEFFPGETGDGTTFMPSSAPLQYDPILRTPTLEEQYYQDRYTY